MFISIHLVVCPVLILWSGYFNQFLGVDDLIINAWWIICVYKLLLLILLLTQISRTSLSSCLVKHLSFVIALIFTRFCCCAITIVNKGNLFILKLDNYRFVDYYTVVLNFIWILGCLLSSFIKIKWLLRIWGLLSMKILWLLLLLILYKVFIFDNIIFIFLWRTEHSLFLIVLILKSVSTNECFIL